MVKRYSGERFVRIGDRITTGTDRLRTKETVKTEKYKNLQMLGYTNVGLQVFVVSYTMFV